MEIEEIVEELFDDVDDDDAGTPLSPILSIFSTCISAKPAKHCLYAFSVKSPLPIMYGRKTEYRKESTMICARLFDFCPFDKDSVILCPVVALAARILWRTERILEMRALPAPIANESEGAGRA